MSHLTQGTVLSATEATETFFSITKLFQSNDVTLRRLVYLAIKEMANISNDVIIVTSRLVIQHSACINNSIFCLNSVVLLRICLVKRIVIELLLYALSVRSLM